MKVRELRDALADAHDDCDVVVRIGGDMVEQIDSVGIDKQDALIGYELVLDAVDVLVLDIEC